MNVVSGTDSFIGAGDGNAIASNEAFIGGGGNNAISSSGSLYSAIGGGYGNKIASTTNNGGEYAAIAGGADNAISGLGAAIGGGYDNVAGGEFGTVPGGKLNAANGFGSFAAGTGAKALQNGTFVWSDNAGTTGLVSNAPYEFLARASGGFFLFTNAKQTAGVKLAPGSGAWASLSDRRMKTGIVPLDDAAVLEKVARLPVTMWSYTSERGVRHVGPMAQDFYAAFGIGEDDRHITSIDEDGVALAAIKALHAENRSLHAENRDLHAVNISLRQRIVRDEAQRRVDEARLGALERKVETLASDPQRSRRENRCGSARRCDGTR